MIAVTQIPHVFLMIKEPYAKGFNAEARSRRDARENATQRHKVTMAQRIEPLCVLWSSVVGIL